MYALKKMKQVIWKTVTRGKGTTLDGIVVGGPVEVTKLRPQRILQPNEKLRNKFSRYKEQDKLDIVKALKRWGIPVTQWVRKSIRQGGWKSGQAKSSMVLDH